MHNEIEIIYCTEGTFEAIIDSEKYVINEGEMSIAFPNQSHYYLHDKEKQLSVYLLIFKIQTLSEIEETLKNGIPDSSKLTVSDRKYVESILSEMYKHKKTDDYSLLKQSGLLKLLSAYIVENSVLIDHKKADPIIIENIVNFCNNNFTSDIHLSDLAKNLHVNKYYISHIFSDKLKISFTEYINSLRIDAAKKLLQNSDKTVNEIAYSVGYNTVRNFNRIFFKFTGKTPIEFKKSKLQQKKHI
jgi:YesN/AraC family two-component response regulator